LGGKTGKYSGKNPGKYPVRYLLGIYHSRYLPEKFGPKLKLVNTLGIYLWVFTSRFFTITLLCVITALDSHFPNLPRAGFVSPNPTSELALDTVCLSTCVLSEVSDLSVVRMHIWLMFY